MITVKVRDRHDGRPLQLYYVDPVSGRRRTKSAGTRDRRQAEREAAKWEAELSQGKRAGQVSWDVFRNRLFDEHAAQLAKRSGHAFRTSLNHFERIIGRPRTLQAVNASVISEFQSVLRAEGLSEHSIANYLRHLKAALGWAKRIGLLDSVPQIQMPKLSQSKRRLARSRSVTAREAVLMLRACDELLGDPHAARWRHFIKGLWWSGLRLGEALKLTWNEYPVMLDLDGGRYPQIRWHSEGQKRKRDEIIPLTPDFHAFISRTPMAERVGAVFPLTHPSRTVTYRVAIAIMKTIGERAGVQTGPGKHATAHDLRRAFGQRWARQLPPLELKKLMRHSSIETTMAYYVDLDADDLAGRFWGNGG